MNARRTNRRPAIWAALRRLRTATAEAILAEVGGTDSTVRAYMDALVKAGHVERRPDPAGVAKWVYAVAERAPVIAPSVRPDGQARSHGDQQDRMWRSMKMLQAFTVRDLAITASLKDQPVTELRASKYVHWLLAAGYLVVKQPPKGGRRGTPGLYRLARNTGPRAPQVHHKAGEVSDPNLGTVVWRKPVKAVSHAA